MNEDECVLGNGPREPLTPPGFLRITRTAANHSATLEPFRDCLLSVGCKLNLQTLIPFSVGQRHRLCIFV